MTEKLTSSPGPISWIRRQGFWIAIAMILGLFGGLAASLLGTGAQFAAWLDLPGRIFIDLLKMVIVPLVFTSIVVGVSSLGSDIRRLGRIGGKTFLYYFSTTGIAVTIGLFLVNWIEPGTSSGAQDANVETVVEIHDAKPPADMASLSVVNGIPAANGVDVVTVMGPTLFQNIGFAVLTAPVVLPPGSVQLAVRDTTTGKVWVTLPPHTFAPGETYRLVLGGRPSTGTLSYSISKVEFPRVVGNLSATHTQVRVVHAAPMLPAVEATDDQYSFLAPPIAADIHQPGRFELPANSAWTLRLNTGQKPVIRTFAGDELKPGAAYTIYIVGQRQKAEPTQLVDVLLGMIPTNVVRAIASGDVLPIIFFALLFGLALSLVGEPAVPVVRWMDGAFSAVMKITGWVMWLAPIGVFALLGKVMAEMGPDVLARLVGYMATVLGGLFIHGVIVLPLLLYLFARVNPFRFAKAMSRALATALATSSSSATLPVTLECAEHKAGVSNRVASFVLPLGATVNMDGTALYEAVAALFIAQIYGVDLSFGQQVVVFLTATLAAVGAAGVPSAGLVTMVMVLRAVGLPEEGIGLIVGVDRVLDLFRTTVNVWGDCVGAAIVARAEGELDEAKLQ